MDKALRKRAILTDGLQRRGFGTRVLRNAVAHAGHPVAGRAMTVTLPTGVGLRISAEESLERRSDLRLATDRRENQHSLEGVYQVGEVPDVLRSADRPWDHVRHPGDTHHDHEFHAYAAQRCPETKERRKTQICTNIDAPDEEMLSVKNVFLWSQFRGTSVHSFENLVV